MDLNTGLTGGAIRTLAGGNLNVSAEYGDVNAGNNIVGYDFNAPAAPDYTVDPLWVASAPPLGAMSQSMPGAM